MTFSQALAEDMPLLIGTTWRDSAHIAHAFELKAGGLAFVLGGYGRSPSPEAHVVEGTIEGDGPWWLTARAGGAHDGLRLLIRPTSKHVVDRGTPEDALTHLAFWFDDLHRADLVLR
jgi:hypothetical protein